MGAPMGRLIGPGQPGVQHSGVTGEFGIQVDLTNLPLSTATIVSGETVMRDGEPTDARPGRLVRGEQRDGRC